MKNLFIKSMWFILGILYLLGLSLVIGCQQEDLTDPVSYSNDIYDLKTYKVERHPPVVRNGFGMDIFHQGNSGLDTMYLSDDLPAYHPNNCADTGAYLYYEYEGENYEFLYDLLFYNEFAYSQNATGDYNATGFPVIFMYTDPTNSNNCTKAAMVGQGIDCFEAFTYDSIYSYVSSLTADPQVCMADYRTYLNNETVQGTITLRDDVSALYETLTIGNKFRPNIGGIFNLDDVSDETQIDLQPVFLIQTREGLYAKFMVTRFKGTGTDTQRLTLQWQALKAEE